MDSPACIFEIDIVFYVLSGSGWAVKAYDRTDYNGERSKEILCF